MDEITYFLRYDVFLVFCLPQQVEMGTTWANMFWLPCEPLQMTKTSVTMKPMQNSTVSCKQHLAIWRDVLGAWSTLVLHKKGLWTKSPTSSRLAVSCTTLLKSSQSLCHHQLRKLSMCIQTWTIQCPQRSTLRRWNPERNWSIVNSLLTLASSTHKVQTSQSPAWTTHRLKTSQSPAWRAHRLQTCQKICDTFTNTRIKLGCC